MKKNNIIRDLARSHKWQTLYSRAKDLGLKLFSNKEDLTRLQIIFLDYLELYSSLYQDVAMEEEGISMEKIKDDIMVDAYLVFKKRQRSKKKSKNKKERKKNNTSVPNLVFTKGKKVKK